MNRWKNAIRHWLPSPLTSLALLLSWLLLNQTLEAAHLLLGTVLAVLIPVRLRRLQPLATQRLKKPVTLFKLLAMALVEIVRSGFAVGRITLLPGTRNVQSNFVRVPLDLSNPYGLALLSCLINSTPGTVWVEILPGTSDLALHVLDLQDEQWWIDTIKTRYEKPLIEVFEQDERA